jgi:hypothetical protein
VKNIAGVSMIQLFVMRRNNQRDGLENDDLVGGHAVSGRAMASLHRRAPVLAGKVAARYDCAQ